MNLAKLYYSIFILVLLTATACEKEEPEIINEEELITTLIYTLTPEDGGQSVIFSFTDLDGDGGNEPTIVSQPLSLNTVYSGTVELLNEQESPAEDITEEVEEEAEEHQFFYSSDVPTISIAYDDTDVDGKPIGLKTKFTTQSASSGKLKITLRHEPNKDASGVSSGDITNAGGETDIEVEFDVTFN